MRPTMSVNVERFVQHINEVKRETGRDSEEMLKYVMLLMLRAGRSATPLGRKNRALQTEEVWAASEGAESGISERLEKRSFYVVYHQSSPEPEKVYLPKLPRKSKKNAALRAQLERKRESIKENFRRIKFRGIARASWGWAMRMVSSKASLTGEADELAEKATSNPITVNKKLTSTSPSIEVINKLGWIRKISPRIEWRMLSSADSHLRKWLEKRWQTGINRAERRHS